MKSKLKLQLIIVLSMVLLLVILAGCSIGMDSLEDILQKNDLTVRVIYYSNGGWFNDDTQSISRDVYYKDNSKALELTGSTQTKIRHADYVYDGWWTIQTVQIDGIDHFVCDVTADQADDYKIDGVSAIVSYNGNYLIKVDHYQQLVATANVPLLALDKPFDFANTTLKSGSTIYLATKWVPNQTVDYVLITEDCSSITVRKDDGSIVTYNNGDIIASKTFDSKGLFAVPTDYNLSPVNAEDATFVDYYLYEENAQLQNLTRLADVTTSISRPEEGNVKVFVKYVAGQWDVLRFAKDVKKIFNSPAKSYYLSRDVDCSNEQAILPIDTFRGTIRGNGHTIEGIKATVTRVASGEKVALFGTMADGAVIKDIIFKNISLSCETRPGENSFVNVFLIAHTLRDGATVQLSNVNFSGVTVSVTLASGVSLENVPFDGTNYNTENWLFKGFTNSQFLANFPTVTIQNYKLIINNQIVATDTSVA